MILKIHQFNTEHNDRRIIFHDTELNSQILICLESTINFSDASARLTLPHEKLPTFTTRRSKHMDYLDKQLSQDDAEELRETAAVVRNNFIDFYDLAKKKLVT